MKSNTFAMFFCTLLWFCTEAEERLADHLLFSFRRDHAIIMCILPCTEAQERLHSMRTWVKFKSWSENLLSRATRESWACGRGVGTVDVTGKELKSLCKEKSPLVSFCVIISTVGHCSTHCIYSNFQCHTILWKRALRNYVCTHPVLHPPPFLSKSVPMLFRFMFCFRFFSSPLHIYVGLNISDTFRKYSLLSNFIIVMFGSHIWLVEGILSFINYLLIK